MYLLFAANTTAATTRFMNDLTPFLSIIGGFIVAFVAIILFEFVRRPNIEVFLPESDEVRYAQINGKPSIGQPPARLAKIGVTNKPLSRKFWLPRHPAVSAKCLVTLYDAEDKQIVGNLRGMRCKWDASLEPSAVKIPQFDLTTGKVLLFFNASNFVYYVQHANILDLNSKADPEYVAIAIKVDGDNNCYPFGGESYQYPDLRDRARMIPQGDYTLHVVISSDNMQSREYRFRLRNHGPTSQGLSVEPLSNLS